MLALLAATLLWSFSFGIIKQQLVGLPEDGVALARLALAALVFLPWAYRRGAALPRLRLALLGSVQFGLMYLLYLRSYLALEAWEVALFTAFTPLWVLLLEAGLPGGRGRLGARTWAAMALCILGAALIRVDPALRPDFGRGFLWVQAANLCFAFGQVAYRRQHHPRAAGTEAAAHAWMFLGGAALCGAVFLVRELSSARAFAGLQLGAGPALALLYLGVVASGLGFFLWNYGARRVSAGLLATSNNLKVPCAVLVSVLLFGESLAPSGATAEWARKLLGIALVLGAVAWAGRHSRDSAPRRAH